MLIRKATEGDLKQIMDIYQTARRFMEETGNPSQWSNGYPSYSLLASDIDREHLYVCVVAGEIAGVFALMPGPDPTYAIIEGRFRCEDDYGVIHRLASNGRTKNIAKTCFDFCRQRYAYLRIDTHRDNQGMQVILKKYGFEKCGLIWLEDGSERIAFDYLG
ncbi:N-acetyltransferase family protein [Streptococcus sp. 10F2]